MKPFHKGLILAALHLALVCALGGKLLMDRARYPRVWVKTVTYDPNLPIRGRYARVQVVVKTPDVTPKANGVTTVMSRARLEVRGGDLYAIPAADGTEWYQDLRGSSGTYTLGEPVAFFLPEHVADPTRRGADEELWAEVTVPRKGPPRPIRLGVKKDGIITPLALD